MFNGVAQAEYKWVLTERSDINNGNIVMNYFLDIEKISSINGYKFAWTKNTGNIGKKLINTFVRIKVDCGKKIWTPVYNEQWENGVLTAKRENMDWHWNMFDFTEKRDIITFNFVCG
jgi:hypothetical protein